MPQPKRVHALTDALLAAYRQVWDRITRDQQALINDWTALNRVARLNRLRALQATVEQLMDHADEQAAAWVNNELPQAYLYGAAASRIGGVAFTKPDLDALGVLVGDTLTPLLAATSFVRESTKDLIRTLTREHLTGKLVGGQTATQAGRLLERAVAERGIAAVVYADGSRHGLAEYAQVVARTQTATAYNVGNLTRFRSGGVTFAECFDSPDCGLDGHDDEEKPNGQLYPLSVMEDFSISHPNCLRSWGARPDVSSQAEADVAVGSASAAQNVDQAQVAVSRQEAAIARAFSRRQGGRLSDGGSRVSGAPHAAVLSKRAGGLARRRQRVGG